VARRSGSESHPVGGVGISGVESSGFVTTVLESGHGTVTRNTEMRDS
jgi:hypothetical protein